MSDILREDMFRIKIFNIWGFIVMNIYAILHRLYFSPCSPGWQDLEIKPYKAPTEKIFASKQEKAEAFAEAAKQVGNTSLSRRRSLLVLTKHSRFSARGLVRARIHRNNEEQTCRIPRRVP